MIAPLWLIDAFKMATKKKKRIWDAPGAAPSIQGYWARAEGRERVPPTWHPGHDNKEWIELWLGGWDDRDSLKRAE